MKTIQTLDDAINAFLEVKPEFRTVFNKPGSPITSERNIYTSTVPSGKITIEQKYIQRPADSMTDEGSLAMQGLPPYRSANLYILRVIENGKIVGTYDSEKVEALYQKVSQKEC